MTKETESKSRAEWSWLFWETIQLDEFFSLSKTNSDPLVYISVRFQH